MIFLHTHMHIKWNFMFKKKRHALWTWKSCVTLWATDSVKENDFLIYGLPTDWALCDLIRTELARAMTTQEHTVLASVHAHLTLSLHKQVHVNVMVVPLKWVSGVDHTLPFPLFPGAGVGEWLCPPDHRMIPADSIHSFPASSLMLKLENEVTLMIQ